MVSALVGGGDGEDMPVAGGGGGDHNVGNNTYAIYRLTITAPTLQYRVNDHP